MFGSRPSFGAGSTGFGGFGSNTTPSTFGASTFGRPSFGTPQTTAANSPFGSTTNTGSSSLFGQNQTSGGGLFGSTNTSSGFGSTSTGFGSSGGGLFGASNTQTSTTGLFGSTTTSTGFNANQNQTRPFSFGTPTTSANNTGALFGSTNTGSTLFGSAVGQQTQGTTVKYSAVTGSDTMTRGGVSQNIQTKIEVITAMKEYESKSLEELRTEDYAAGRKGPTQGSTGFGFGQNKYTGTQPTNKGWMSTDNSQGAGGLFASKPVENKPLFGAATSTAFGTSSSGGLFGQTAATPFGQSTTAPSTGFSFGQNNQAKPSGFSFGQTTSSSSIFGQPAATTQSGTTFGSTGFNFGAQATQSGGLFSSSQSKPVFGAASTGTNLFNSKPAGTSFGSFGAQSSASPFGTTNTNTGTGLFGTQNKPAFALGGGGTGFGATSTGFGTGGGLFGSTSTSAKPGGLSFGTTNAFGTNTSAGGFGFSQPATGGGLFGSASGTGGGLFGSTNTNLNTGSNFGSTLGFGSNPLQTNNTMAPVNMGVVSNDNISNLIKALTHNPFGTSSLLKSAAAPTGKADELLNASSSATSSDATNANKHSTSKKPTYVLPSGTGMSLKPRPIDKTNNGFSDFDASKSMLFAGLEEKNDSFSEDPFKPKSFPSVKKLNLKVFKHVKSISTAQSTTNGSILNENSALPSPLTTPISCRETPTRNSLSPSQGHSPTPDIIKGRNNIKRLNIPAKNNLNDTYADLGVAASNRPIEEVVRTTEKDTNISLYEASSLEDIPQAVDLTSAVPHPAGIKLSRSGYYTIPSMENLGEMMDSDGCCMVENFTVGRYGYGNVCFQGVTNVANLDLDSIVFIVRKEVEVYPEGIDKPNVGEGLNKLAFVTLDCVWPVDKTTHEVIKSEDRLEAMGWSEYLERQCIKMEATFVEYRPETGSWVFKVKHFSKYGLQDDNEEVTPPGTAKAIETTAKENIPPQSCAYMPSPIAPSTKSSNSMNQFSGAPLTFLNSSNKGAQGPPALGLNSPPNNLLHFQPETAVSVAQKMFLDGSSLDLDERDMFEPVGEDYKDGEDILMCPLSPSAERLTISSKAPPRAIQSLKSQLFFEDIEEEDLYCVSKGQKRESDEATAQSHLDQSSLFALKGYSKKLLMGPDESFEHSEIPPKLPDISKMQTLELNQDESRTLDVPKLQDPKTEYQLLSSLFDQESDISRQQTHHLASEIAMDSGLAFKGKNCIADMSAFMGKSFRVGWGPGWTIAHPGSSIGKVNGDSPTEVSDDSTSQTPFLFCGSTDIATSQIQQPVLNNCQRRNIHIEKVHLAPEVEPKGSLNMLEACLGNVLECCEMEDDDDGDFQCPQFSPSKKVDLLQRLTLTAAHIEDSENHDRKLSTIFDLCSALWGQLDFYCPDSDGDSEYANAKARKEALSQWLEEVSESAVTEETEFALSLEEPEAYLDAVYSHLTARQISSACNLAQDKSDHHLALLLAQTCLGDETPRQIINQQLSNWSWANIDKFISTKRLVLYSLLGGKATHDASHIEINTCTGLDWRRALALHLWYVCPTTATIAEALEMYEKAAGLSCSDSPIYCDEPKPSYLDSNSLPGDVKINHDICFQLLKLYVDPSHPLESLLEPSTITPDPMDVTISWLLWCTLKTLGYNQLSVTKMESLNTSMAALLEANDMWHWAAFVILTSPDEYNRRFALGELLNRHLLVECEEGKDDPFYREKEHFLIHDLKLSEKWLHRAKAVRAKALKLVDEETWYLLKSERYSEAHDLIVDSIAPHAVVNEDHEHLLSYLEEFSDETVQNSVTEWSSGGGIYKNYLEVITQVEELKETRKPTGVNVERLRPRLLALCTRLNNLKCPTAVHRLCISEMSRMVVSVLRAILVTEPEGIRVLAQQVSVLPLAHECALEELNIITNQYLTQVTMDS